MPGRRIVEEVAPALKRGRGVIGGFSAFVRQYGVAPLAIGVVLGTAVNDLVKSIVDGLVTPFISLVSPTTKLQDFTFTVGVSVFKVGAVINALLSFLTIALVVYVFAKIVLKDDSVLQKK